MSLRPGMIKRFHELFLLMEDINKDLSYIENDFNANSASEEERSQVKHLRAIANRPFDETFGRLQHLFAKEIVVCGKLEKNNSGRYQIVETDYYFTSGSKCEAYLPYWGTDSEEENPLYTWVPTSIEFNNNKHDYYFTAEPDISLLGIIVRVRK